MGYARDATRRRPRAQTEGRPRFHGVCLLRPIRTVRAATPATFESLGKMLSSHRAITRVAAAALSFTLIIAFSQHTATTQAGPDPIPVAPESLLPQSIGLAIATDLGVTIPFEDPMDPDSVESTVQILPAARVTLAWNDDHTELTVAPQRLWRTSERYLIVVPATAEREDGTALRAAQRYAFSTQTAPSVSEFQVRLVAADVAPAVEPVAQELATDGVTTTPTVGSHAPTTTATEVSATSAIRVGFTAAMDKADTESHFSINPTVEGDLAWEGNTLVFRPSERLEAGARYTISVIGAHDLTGNVLGGKANFSFIVKEGAQLTRTTPDEGAEDVEPEIVEMWFSAPMDVEATNAAFGLTDTSTDALVGGVLSWNDAATQLVYRPDAAFAGGRTFEVSLDGALDVDGNDVDLSWSFSTKAPPAPAAPPPPRADTSTRTAPAPAAPAPAPAPPPPAPATSLAGHALNQVNAARAAYGFAPVVLDPAISAVAAAHAWDQAYNNYFSHTGRNGSTRESRLRAGGVSFSWSGENQCYHIGMSQRATLDWCHQQFMAEPYPGYWNHIANILNPNAKRMGIGIATVGSKTIITWNFTN
jgi:uncharacterized protein YkwD